MLEELHILNYALIERVSLEFSSGFTVFTGETGAGKSILIGALSFVLGGRGGTEQIRVGAKDASVQAVFSVPEQAMNWLSDRGIETESNRVMLRRIIRDTGKSSAWIEGVPVSRADLSEFTAFLVDIHGQHEHQSLLRVSEHRRFLDSYAGIEKEVAAFSDLYGSLVEKRALLQELEQSETDRERRREMLAFALEEINAARLRPGEDAELADEEQRLSRYEQLYADMETAAAIASGEEFSLVNAFRQFEAALKRAAESDRALESLASRAEALFYELSDITEEVRSYRDALTYDPDRLAEVQERSALFYRLKKKYASSVNAPLEEVIAHGEGVQAELLTMDTAEESRQELVQAIEELEKQTLMSARALSAKRHEAGTRMAHEVERVLAALGMSGTRFEVSIQDKSLLAEGQRCGPYGIDDIEFMIAPNAGLPLRPLAKIASGGELSRVMLALKTVLAETDSVSTLIFDEIDTGIGGEIALSLGSHIKGLSFKRQILCITHLSSIAVFADSQIKIAKKSDGNSVVTEAFVLAESDRVEEIARMLSGDSYSRESLEYARSLLAKYKDNGLINGKDNGGVPQTL